jgi:tRNA A37 threonylcarbamoyladenosine synthetase subunit TsaC/SUA5/YrdC
VLDGGPIRGGPASTVVDCSVALPVVLRVGAIPAGEIAAALDAAGIAHAIRS